MTTLRTPSELVNFLLRAIDDCPDSKHYRRVTITSSLIGSAWELQSSGEKAIFDEALVAVLSQPRTLTYMEEDEHFRDVIVTDDDARPLDYFGEGEGEAINVDGLLFELLNQPYNSVLGLDSIDFELEVKYLEKLLRGWAPNSPNEPGAEILILEDAVTVFSTNDSALNSSTWCISKSTCRRLTELVGSVENNAVPYYDGFLFGQLRKNKLLVLQKIISSDE